jgi:hypothetical protein
MEPSANPTNKNSFCDLGGWCTESTRPPWEEEEEEGAVVEVEEEEEEEEAEVEGAVESNEPTKGPTVPQAT